MDFFNDHILTDLDRSDYVGGIDNEAIFFEDLHVATSVGSLDADGGRSSSLNGVESATFVCSAKAETPVTSPTSIPLQEPTLPPIPTISARVSVTSTAHIGIHATNSNSNNLTHSHLPESPPDSSSEPPFSPSQDVHGLTLTSRDLYNGPGIENNVASAIHELHTLPTQQQHHSHHPSQQYATSPPEHQQSHTNNYSHLLQSSHENANGLVRVKHESSLLVNPSALQTIFNNRSVDTHAEIPTSHSFYSNNTHLNYDSLANKMYAPTITSSSSSYQLDLGNVDLNSSISTSSACMLNTVTDLPHVQAVGTSHASIPSTPQLSRTSTPSTPNHQSLSRKRKMTTDIDCSEYTSIKPDPGLVMSPSRSALCVTPLKSANESKVSPTSPLNIQLSSQNSTSASDLCSTAPHSTASLSPALSISNTNGEICVDTSKNSENGIDTLSPCIKFTAFQPQSWHKLCDQNLQELSVVYYRVDADKGFNFSISDDAFVCQKKNHFQITCHARLQGEAKFVKTPSGLEKIKSFHLHFYGVKLEAPNQTIRVEQSQSDRSKKPFYPVPIDLQSHIVSKVTVGRLHFSETTNNNMRKKGRPNPEQRYFQLVVALHVHTASGDFPIVSQGSDKIIVRASNPGQFESDVDLCWQRGLTQDSIYHAGRVGINTDRPDESLVVHGNLKISGHIVQPSDSRAKQEIGELDTSVQLRNLQKIRIVRYRLEPEFALHSGLKCKNGSGDIVDTGVIAQEVREVIPDAVQEAGSIVLPNGNVIENFLLVNKDRILMENIGAVKELCKVTGTLESRIENLERVNHRLQRAKDTELQFMRNKIIANKQNHEICSNRTLQITIFLLVIVMAACLAAVSTLYFVEHSRKQHVFKHLESIHVLSNGHVYRPDILSLAEQERIYLNNRSNKTHNFLYQSASSTVAMSSNYTKYRGEIISGGMETIEDIVPTLQSRNDELTAIMEKPSVENELKQFNPEPLRSITSHMVRTNKTINSKTKIKPQVGRNTVFRAIYNRPNEGVSLQATDASDTSSERIAGGNELLQPDLDNNSIDTDHKPVTSKTRLPQIKDNSRHSDIQKLNTETLVSGLRKSQQDNAPPQIHHVHRSNAVIDESGLYKTSSPLNLLVSTTISTTTSLGTVTSRISQKVNTEAPHANYSLDIQPISNKSRHILDRTTDNAEDLQSLTNNNESAYNTISDPLDFIFYNIRAPSLSSTTQHKHHQAQNTDAGDWLISRHFYTDTFGEPEHCNNKIERADISNCQSVCFEENNQLLAPNHLSLGLKPSETKRSKTLITQEAAIGSEKSNERTDDDDDETERVLQENDDELQASYGGSLHLNLNSSRLLVAGKSSHSTQALTKQLSAEQRSAEIVENLDTILEHGFSNDNEPKATKQERHDFPNQKQIQQTKLLIEPNRPPSSADCWKVHSCILAERVNKTFSVDEYCPKLGKSMNVTFTVPLSRYFKEQSIELHLTSTSPLHWVLCNNHELTKTNGKHLPTTQQTLQRLRNTSLLLLNIPSRGYFVKDLNLRATSDTEKATICEEKTYETNPILQYNFRILRNCD